MDSNKSNNNEVFWNRYYTYQQDFKNLKDQWIKSKEYFDNETVDLEKFKLIQHFVTEDPSELHLTHMAKRMTTIDFPNAKDDHVNLDVPVLPWEETFILFAYNFAKEFHGEPVFDYSSDSRAFNDVDAWVNTSKVGRIVTPGIAEDRLKRAKSYESSDINTTKILEKSQSISLAVQLMASNLGSGLGLVEQRDNRLPYQGRQTNVGYPFYSNAKSKFKYSGENLSEKKKELEESYKGKSYGNTVWEISNHSKFINQNEYERGNVGRYPNTLLARSQTGGLNRDDAGYPYVFKQITSDGKWSGQSISGAKWDTVFKPSKGRDIAGGSRIRNEYDAKVILPIIGQMAKAPTYIGYTPKDNQIRKLKQFERYCKSKGFKIYSTDWSNYDKTIIRDEWVLNYTGIVDNFKQKSAKDMLKATYFNAYSSFMNYVENGTVYTLQNVLGLLPSGSLPTGEFGSQNNVTRIYACLIEIIPNYTKMVQAARANGIDLVFALGDDLTFAAPADISFDKIQKAMKKLYNLQFGSPKDARGILFLQQRIENGVWSTPIIRYFYKAFYAESTNRLGPIMNVLRVWSLLSNAITEGNSSMTKPSELGIVLNVLHDLDKFAIGLNLTVKSIKQALQSELKAMDLGTAADVLYDGDPAKIDMFEETGDISSDYLIATHRIFKTNLAKSKSLYEAKFKKYFEKYIFKQIGK